MEHDAPAPFLLGLGGPDDGDALRTEEPMDRSHFGHPQGSARERRNRRNRAMRSSGVGASPSFHSITCTTTPQRSFGLNRISLRNGPSDSRWAMRTPAASSSST